MIAEAAHPKSSAELLAVANERYGLSWTTETQIHRRRGWLQSAGMMRVAEDRRLVSTPEGLAVAERLEVAEPRDVATLAPGATVTPLVPSTEEQVDQRVGELVSELVAEVDAASTDSASPDRLEQAVRAAFEYLGFEAKWLGGSGKTDVLLQAEIGKKQSYRVVVDAKSTSSGSVSDAQVDWITLRDHRKKHGADHVALVGPRPTGQRLFERATENGVAVVSTERLVALLRQHALAPLGLDAYKEIFTRPGEFEPDALSERAEEWLRLARIAAAALSAIRDRADRTGPLTARELYLILDSDALEEDPAVEEIQSILETLASPLVGLLHGEPDSGYVVVASPAVTRARLAQLASFVGR